MSKNNKLDFRQSVTLSDAEFLKLRKKALIKGMEFNKYDKILFKDY